MASVIEGESAEGQPCVCRARLVKDGTAIVQSGLSAPVEYEVWLIDDPSYDQTAGPATKFTGPHTIAVSACIFNTLQAWEVDATGYNFAATIPADHIPPVPVDNWQTGRLIRIEFKFTPASGPAFGASFRVTLEPWLFGK